MTAPRSPSGRFQQHDQQVEQHQEGARIEVNVDRRHPDENGAASPAKRDGSAATNNANLWRMLFLTIGVIVGGGFTAGGLKAFSSLAGASPLTAAQLAPPHPSAAYVELVKSIDTHLTSVDSRLTALEKTDTDLKLARARWEQSIDDKLGTLIEGANKPSRRPR